MSQDALVGTWKESLRGSLSGDLESHPGRTLISHLFGTESLARQIVDFCGFDELNRNVSCCSLTHDIGKADKIFQLYLHGSGRGVNHSRPSAKFTLSLLQDRGELLEAFFSAEAVRRHHSCIDSWETIVSDWMDIYENFPNAAAEMKHLAPDWPYTLEKDFVKKFVYTIDDQIIGEAPFSEYWLKLRTLLSILVAADRLDAINVPEIKFEPLPAFTPYDFTAGKTFSERRQRVNEWRSEAAQACLESVPKVERPGLFTLTLPTGAGKTNIGLKVAHTLAEKLKYSTIVYALPFISIVEQNADFAKKVFDPVSVQEDHSLMLARDEEKDGEDDVIAASKTESQAVWRKVRRLFRYWNAPVVITTMAQLWSTLLSPKAGSTIDFHRLSRAVVLMDEPQGIAPNLWDGLGKLLSFIHDRWKTVFILMTATQPKIYEGFELAPSLKFPFNRHRYRFIDEKFLLEDIPTLLKEHIPDFLERSGMMVFNTRKAARKAYDLMLPVLGKDNVFVLSRWMTPQHRREVIKAIKDLERTGQKHYLIATQVVEAGVDLDFEWVFRDLAPLDSIIQVAGRCNRSAERETEGTVLITELQSATQDQRKNSFCKFVYDAVPLDITREYLQECHDFAESEVPSLVDRYYKELTRRLKSEPIWENICDGKWDQYTPLFKSDSQDVPVYIDHDGKLDDILNELLTMKRNLENRDQWKQLNTLLQQYAVGVSERLVREWMDHSPMLIGDTQEMSELVGDHYYVIRRTGIGVEGGKMYHPVAGFSPYQNKTLEDW